MDETIEARKRSVDNLQRLYVIVVALSIVHALTQLTQVIRGAGLGNFTGYAEHLFMFVSFLLTVVPFFHGSMCYLDQRYVIQQGETTRCALMIDFIALFIQGLLLFALSTMIGQINVFYNGLVGLLVFDIGWVGATSLTGENHKSGKATTNDGKTPGKTESNERLFRKWAVINAVAIWAILICVWSTLWGSPMVKGTMLVIIALYRTVLDYLLVWDWYYPDIPVPPPARPMDAKR